MFALFGRGFDVRFDANASRKVDGFSTRFGCFVGVPKRDGWSAGFFRDVMGLVYRIDRALSWALTEHTW